MILLTESELAGETQYYYVCRGSTLKVICITQTSHGWLTWMINDKHLHNFHKDAHNIWESSDSSNITLELTNSTKTAGGEYLYISRATVRNVREETTIKCSDGQNPGYIIHYLFESMPINFLLHYDTAIC